MLPGEGPFDIVASSPNALPLDSCCYKTASSNWSERLPPIAVWEALVGDGFPISSRSSIHRCVIPVR